MFGTKKLTNDLEQEQDDSCFDRFDLPEFDQTVFQRFKPVEIFLSI